MENVYTFNVHYFIIKKKSNQYELEMKLMSK